MSILEWKTNKTWTNDEFEMNLVPIKKAITGFGDKEVS